MKKLILPFGTDMFSDVRNGRTYYIDKTDIIEQIISENTKCILFARPRRFGKSLMMSMMAEFFDIRKDNKAMFEGLKISENKELCAEWMNQRPVIFLSLKDVEGINGFDSAIYGIKDKIASLCRTFDSELIGLSGEQKEKYFRLHEEKANAEELAESLRFLSEVLFAHFGKKVIILIDEYDVPVAKAEQGGYYDRMIAFMRVFLSSGLKSNPYLEFAILTGCLRIAKESIFTGMNNFRADTVFDFDYSRYFGYTEEEVIEILKYYDLEDKLPVLKKSYDGYRFGETDMYCPWSVNGYVKDLINRPNAPAKYFWANSSGNDVILEFLKKAGDETKKKFEILLSGGCICQEIREGLTYNYLKNDEKNLWSLLYYTGYLTLAREGECDEDCPDGTLPLRIPNEEVRETFKRNTDDWFSEYIRETDPAELFDALWSGNAENAENFLRECLLASVSYNNTSKENFYHGFMSGLFYGGGYRLESDRENGDGRYDILIPDWRRSRVILLELKKSAQQEDMEKDVEEALNQIKEKKYLYGLDKRYKNIFAYGIAFYKKRCRVKRYEEEGTAG